MEQIDHHLLSWNNNCSSVVVLGWGFWNRLAPGPKMLFEFAVRCCLELEDPLPKGFIHRDDVVLLARGRALVPLHRPAWVSHHASQCPWEHKIWESKACYDQYCFFWLHLSHRTCLYSVFVVLGGMSPEGSNSRKQEPWGDDVMVWLWDAHVLGMWLPMDGLLGSWCCHKIRSLLGGSEA